MRRLLFEVVRYQVGLLCLASAVAAHAQQGPAALNVGGNLFAADGAPLTGTSVSFHVEIWDAANTCRLYSEDHPNQNLNASRGAFSLVIGGGSSRQNLIAGSTTLNAQVFLNPGSIPAFAGCPSPPTLNSGAARSIHISYDLGAGMTALTPNVPLVSSAYAMIAETLQGKTADQFIQVNVSGSSALSQTNAEYAFSAVNWPKLQALIDGTSSQYFAVASSGPIDFNGQRLSNIGAPTAAQDATTKTYVDGNVGGRPLDVSAVGPMVGNNSTLLWDATANKWVAGQLVVTATGSAAGDLAGTYPNPTIRLGAVTTAKIADGAITAAKISTTGIGANRLVISDATTGAALGFMTCAQNEILKFDLATGWGCTTVATLSPVTSVAGKTGAVTLNAADIGGLGTAALQDYGTAANQLPRLDGSGRLPAVDGSSLFNVNATRLQTRAVAATAPLADQVLTWNNSAAAWEPRALPTVSGFVTRIDSGLGLLGGPITTTGTLSVDVGVTANKIVQLDASARLPAVDGALVTNVNAAKIATRTVATTAPALGQVLGWNVSATQWEPVSAATGSVTNVASGVGLLGGPITSNGTLNVDVGTTASKILQLNGSAQIPAVDASLVTNVNAVKLQARNVSSAAPTAGQVLGWNATTTQWEPVLGTAGAVTYVQTTNGILGGPITATGTISIDTGTTASKILQLNASAQIPAVDASLLYNVNASKIATRTVAATAPTAGQVIGWNATTTQWEPVSAATGSVTNVASGVGLLGGPITSNGTLNVDVGTTASKILQLNASAQLPAVDASLLYNVKLGGRTVATTAPTANQVVAWNATSTQWEPMSAATGSVTNVATGVGLLGGPITNIGTLNVDVGTAANKILQLNASAQIPAVDGSLLANVNATKLQTRNVAATAPAAGQVLGWNVTTLQWEPTSGNDGSVTNVATANGLLGGPITSNGTLSVDTGTIASKIVQLNASAQIPAVDASLLFNVDASKIATRTVATTAPTANQVIAWNATTTQWEPTSAATGSVTLVAGGTGLLGGPITSGGTLSVDVGSAAGKIVQENANAQIAQTLGSAALPAYTFAGNVSTGVFSPGVNQLALATNGTAVLSIFSNGYVGIGTTTAAQRLTIESPQDTYLTFSQGGSDFLKMGRADSGGALISMLVAGSEKIHLDSRGTNASFFNNGGNFGIGTNLPQAALDVAITGTAASAIIVPRDSTTNRPTAAVNGMLRYNTTTSAMEGFISGTWSSLSTGTSAGTVTNVAGGIGLLGGPITSIGTLRVDVGTAASKIPQLNANAQLALARGSAALPAYAFGADPSSGLWSPANGAIALSISGSEQWRTTTNGTGFGTTTPNGNVDAEQDNGVTAGMNGGSTPLINTGRNGGNFSGLTFGYWSDGTNDVAGAIMSRSGSTSEIVFANNYSNVVRERMRINNLGYVGIGTSTPAAGLDVAMTGTAGSAIIVPRDTTANRPTAAVNGMLRYNSSTNAMEGFINGVWSSLAAGAGVGTVTNVAGGLGLTGGPITSTGTLNVDVGSAAGKIVQENANAQLAQTLGTVALPTYTFAGNPNTGLYSPGANQLALSSNGTAALSVAANGNVGLGVTAPGYRLQLSDGRDQPMLYLENGNTTNTNGAGTVSINGFSNATDFQTYNGSRSASGIELHNISGTSNTYSGLWFKDAAYDVSAGIVGIYESDGGNWGQLAFVTNGGAGPKTRLLIGHDGNIGIGTATPRAGLDIALTGTAASAVIVPRDTTTNRPSAPVNGMLRYNNTLGAMEGFVAGTWSTFATGTAPSGPWLTSGANLYYSAGRVGIGTATPAGLLHVMAPAAAASTNGTDIDLWAQDGGSGNTTGGSVSISPGAGSGTGKGGKVVVGIASAADAMMTVIDDGSYGSKSIGAYVIAENNNGNAVVGQTSNGWNNGVNDVFVAQKAVDGGAGAVGAGAALLFQVASTGGTQQSSGQIASVLTTAGGSNSAAMTFKVESAGALGEAMRIAANGYVGIGTNNPGYPLEVVGTVKATAFLSPSDRRLKDHVRTIDGLTLVRRMRGVSFAWKTTGEDDAGVIAQELEQIVPFLVATDPRTGFKAVKYSSLISPLIEAVKEIDGRCETNAIEIDRAGRRLANVEQTQASVAADVDALKTDNARLRDENERLKARLEKIERALGIQ